MLMIKLIIEHFFIHRSFADWICDIENYKSVPMYLFVQILSYFDITVLRPFQKVLSCLMRYLEFRPLYSTNTSWSVSPGGFSGKQQLVSFHDIMTAGFDCFSYFLYSPLHILLAIMTNRLMCKNVDNLRHNYGIIHR